MLETNAPAIFITLPNVKRQQIRGECCAGHAPPDFAETVPIRTTKQMEPLKKTAKAFGGKIWKYNG